MRVRTITGTTYYTRSGARITGRVHERFMLIDGNRAATGSYRYLSVLSKVTLCPPPTNGHLTISSFILYVNKLNSQKKPPKKLFHVLKKAIFMQASKSNFSSDYDLHCACGSHLNSTWQLSFSNSPLSDRIRPECNLLCSHLWSYYILFFWMHCCL